MKKIAIVNRTNLKNYGSVLQVYALYEVIKKLGYNAEVIWEAGNLSKHYDFRLKKIILTCWKLITHPKLLKSILSNVQNVKDNSISETKEELFDSFVDTYIKREFYPTNMMRKNKVGKIYDKFICGSDQIWCSTTLYVDPLMYLRFVPKEKRIAYAPSLGRNYIPNYNKNIMKKYIKEIPHVSVREYVGQDLVEKLINRDVPVVIDPTLLLTIDDWVKFNNNNNNNGVEQYIVCYFLNTPTKETQQKILNYIKKSNLKVIVLNTILEYIENATNVIYPECGPKEFINYISNAEYVFTDSYHGMLFSIIFERQFCSIEREYGEFDQSSRQMTVLKMLRLENRYCRKEDIITEEIIDYKVIKNILDCEREHSLKYLRNALKN